MRQFWFKIYSAERDEHRIFWLDVPHHKEEGVYNQLKHDVRHVFGFPEDYDFYFTHKDNDNDEIAIKENYEILNYMCRMENNHKLRLSVTPINQERQHIPDSNSSDSASIALNESFQSIIKNLELGMNNLQVAVEKSAVTTVETVMKTAAETAAHVYRSMLPPPTLSEKPQFDVICDGCYTPIRGQRWRCETCEDFDLCSTCKSRVVHDKKHNFRSINNTPQHTQPDIVPDHTDMDLNEPKPLQTIFICDYCDSDIVGIRHTCGACPDFDLCHSCFAIVKENHPEHVFVTRLVGTQANICNQQPKAAKPKKSKTPFIPRESSDTIYHRGVNCDNCQDNVTGIRYKCGHCVNYDLCETCEEYALSIHDKMHAFIKIRYPIQSIIKKPILPKFMPLGDVDQTFSPSTSSAGPSQVQEMTMIDSPKLSVNESNTSMMSVSSAAVSTVEPSTLPIPVPVDPVLSAEFISDINIPDGTLIVPKKTFIKMWKISNNGNTDWPIGTHLLFNGGTILRPHPISRPDSFVVPVISPNEETCVTAELQAPDCPGDYSSYFCLCTPDGVRFGDVLWCTIKVDQDDEPVEMARTVSASDIMMNSSNSMIYPTISTGHEDAQSNDGYTDQDGYSTSTNDQVSTINSARSYTNSHVSSPSSSEIDVGEHHFNDYLSEEETSGTVHEMSDSSINRTYQVVGESGITLVQKNTEEQEDDFVMIDGQEGNDDEEDVLNRNTNSLNSSVHSSQTVTPRRETIPDEVLFRSQLLQLHEMGFTSYDDLAISLLKANKGHVEAVIAKLLYYP
ncbi:hypothetical protein INT47_013032 [Mucor saturninus]|uniref:ZZ-type domain-containing protein n=1 Tax=Mucor saturninus TaxID=64648 RepID=A0A8H7QYT4_9FUNG|nr:hypothetical protein INT47_013032 [Mucor saturninus]